MAIGASGVVGWVLPFVPSSTTTVPQRLRARSSRAASTPVQSGDVPRFADERRERAPAPVDGAHDAQRVVHVVAGSDGGIVELRMDERRCADGAHA
jgi:hypothetical protein